MGNRSVQLSNTSARRTQWLISTQVLGGLTESPAGVYGDLTRSRLTEVYDASTNTWAAGPDLLFDAHEGEVVTAALGGDVYAIRAHYKDGEARRPVVSSARPEERLRRPGRERAPSSDPLARLPHV